MRADTTALGGIRDISPQDFLTVRHTGRGRPLTRRPSVASGLVNASSQEDSPSLVRRVGKGVVRSVGVATSPLRALPDFVLIGTKRGGTTSLYRQIEQHPSYLPLFPSARVLPLRENMKGVHYFDSHSHRSASWYRSHFATRPARALVRRRTGAAFTGDGSPYYLFHPLAAERTRHLLPDAKLLVLLRDPVERTASHWSEQTRNTIETLSFRDALAAEDDRLGGDADRLRRGEILTSHAHEQQSYASQSEYADSLERWMSLYPRDQLLVLFSEDFYTDPQAQLDQVFSFLGVAPHAVEQKAVRNAAPRSPMDDDIRAALQERFAPDVDRVAAITGTTPPWPWWRDR